MFWGVDDGSMSRSCLAATAANTQSFLGAYNTYFWMIFFLELPVLHQPASQLSSAVVQSVSAPQPQPQHTNTLTHTG